MDALAPAVAEAFELAIGRPDPRPILLTCEHASNRLPAPWTWPGPDLRLASDHWAWDPGAVDLARELALDLGAVAVLARFTRLLVDPNRPLDSPNLFRDVADGDPVHLNLRLDAEERRRRIEGYWTPYHAALAEAALALRPRLVLGIHSFTPVYEGTPRSVQLGLLHDGDAELAARWLSRLRAAAPDLDVRIDEPYSGAGGFMYSPSRHASAAACPCLELEVRQDLSTDPTFRRRLAALLGPLVLEEIVDSRA